MNVAVKYLILAAGFLAAYQSFQLGNFGAGITAAGAFIAFAMLEINDLKTINGEENDLKKTQINK